jgi:hypothetical protein
MRAWIPWFGSRVPAVTKAQISKQSIKNLRWVLYNCARTAVHNLKDPFLHDFYRRQIRRANRRRSRWYRSPGSSWSRCFTCSRKTNRTISQGLQADRRITGTHAADLRHSERLLSQFTFSPLAGVWWVRLLALIRVAMKGHLQVSKGHGDSSE